MPMRSKAQRRYLWATAPDVAREFEDATPKGAKLPEKVKMKKSAAAVLLTVLQLNNLKHAMEQGFKPKSATPKLSDKQREPHTRLNPKPVPTQRPSTPPEKNTPAIETGAGSVSQ